MTKRTTGKSGPSQDAGLQARLSQLMCMICRYGANALDQPANRPLRDLWRAIEKNPRGPLVLRQVKDFDGWNPITEGTPGGLYYNLMRDELLNGFQQVSFGSASPAWARIQQLIGRGRTLAKFCDKATGRSTAWKPCPFAHSGAFEKGCEKIRRLNPGQLPDFYRTPEARHKAKTESAARILAARELRVFPNHLKCITCHYGGGLDRVEPNVLHHDNLFEVAEAMRRNPEIPVRLVNAHCMVCPPCASLDTETGLCGICFPRPPSTMTGPLSLLNAMNVTGDTRLPAYRIMRRLYDGVLTTIGSCGDDGCNQPYAYHRGRRAGLGFLPAWENPRAVIRRVSDLLRDPRIRSLVPAAECKLVEETLRSAQADLRKGNKRQAYDRLIERPFWNCWQTYLEKAAVSAARLPRKFRIHDESPFYSREATGRDASPTHPRTARRAVPTSDKARAAYFKTQQFPRCLQVLRLAGVKAGGDLPAERVWLKAPWSGGFQTTGRRPAVAETGVQMLGDAQGLHIGVVCAEREPRRLKADARRGTELATRNIPPYEDDLRQGLTTIRWDESDDLISLIFQPRPDQPEYWQFIFNTQGVKLAQQFSVRDGNRTCRILSSALPWRVSIDIQRSHWRSEVFIPWSVWGMPDHGRRPWRGNVCRIFGQEMPGPRIKFSTGNPAFTYVDDRAESQSPRQALRAPELWAWSAKPQWPEQVHDLSAFGMIVFNN